jgi:hypothetical protein
LAAPSVASPLADFPQPVTARDTLVASPIRTQVIRIDRIAKEYRSNWRKAQAKTRKGADFGPFEAMDITPRKPK